MVIRKRHGIVTQMDIASMADCSQNTVALALRGSTRISKTRRDAIVRIATELDYRPNLAARSLRRGRSGLIGVFTPLLDLGGRSEFVRQMITKLHSADYKPILGTDPLKSDPWYDAPWVETLLELQVEAIVAFACRDDPSLPLPPWHSQVPVILAGQQPTPHLDCDSVSVDRADASRIAVRHLISRGHSRVAMVQPYKAWQYTDGYNESMIAAGLEPEIWTKDDAESDATFLKRFVRDVQKSKEPVTAAFVVDSLRAADLSRVAIGSGLKVPGDLAIVGCGYLPIADKMLVPMTTVERPIDEIVTTAAELVRNRLENRGASPIRVQLPFRFVGRAST